MPNIHHLNCWNLAFRLHDYVFVKKYNATDIEIDINYSYRSSNGQSEYTTNAEIVFWSVMLFSLSLLPTGILIFVYKSASNALMKISIAARNSGMVQKCVSRNNTIGRMFIITVMIYFSLVTPMLLTELVRASMSKFLIGDETVFQLL